MTTRAEGQQTADAATRRCGGDAGTVVPARRPGSLPLLGLMLACFGAIGGCFQGSRELVQRPLEPIGDDDQQIALIPIHGEIQSGPSNSLEVGAFADAEEVVLRLRAAGRDRHVKAVVIDLDTGGGDVTATDFIYRSIVALREQDHKPVVAAMGSVCASGGYYVATAADAVITSPTTITGSIGVIFETPDVHELLSAKLGIGLTVIKSGEFKDMGSPMRDMTVPERALFQAMIDQCYGQFLGVVAERRRGPGPLPQQASAARERIRPIADGRILTGAQALAAGLADAQGTVFDAIATAKALAHLRATPQVVRYERDNGMFGFSEQASPAHINAGIEIGAGLLGRLAHGHMAYLWPAY